MPHNDLLPDNSQVVRFERGFKTWAENTAASVRKNLGLKDVAPLPCENLAQHFGVRIWALDDVPKLPAETNRYLSSPQGDEWSALTVRVSDVDVIVVNTSHCPERRASDIAHEMAHIIRGHEPAKMFISADMGVNLRAYNALQEAEANWLAGCLLLPRSALAYCLARKMTPTNISEHYGVSGEITRYRINVTGVSKQFTRH